MRFFLTSSLCVQIVLISGCDSFRNFGKKINSPQESTREETASETQEAAAESSSARDSLQTDSLQTDSLQTDSRGKGDLSDTVGQEAHSVGSEQNIGKGRHGLSTGSGVVETDLAHQATQLPKKVKSEDYKSKLDSEGEVAKKDPTVLGRECGSGNEGEMRYHARKKRAYYCDGSQWADVPRSAFRHQAKKTNENLGVTNDYSFRCLKSESLSFRCRKSETLPVAH